MNWVFQSHRNLSSQRCCDGSGSIYTWLGWCHIGLQLWLCDL